MNHHEFEHEGDENKLQYIAFLRKSRASWLVFTDLLRRKFKASQDHLHGLIRFSPISCEGWKSLAGQQ